ncbi:hydroxyacylglutathione hydrolase [Antarcticirhabdus aurantiaca]|uniref:Hydroxyacylglutathione hydrolase n=1 Tax=Antarcticirhabdus aurantiaca TaxID=2606717 RepID=A0ACD4NSJ8_9HYPH|nr:hydroxyacylglutathione hydrolase [Antarcticirhabdus aurantiaca]WAJ29873.1 hydroxyacylglutathione hydrolase [Jeongeuplla avenae]
MTDAIDIRLFPARSDNFGVLVHVPRTGATISIDAPEEAPILAALDAAGWRLTHILTTHHHGDHVEANEALKSRFGAKIVGPAGERDRIPGIDRAVAGGERIEVGGLAFEVIDVPGHTLGHVAYHAPEAKALFAGDALFSLGCGRIFEGTPEMLWASLQRLRALPDDTMLYCGHEYTATNARFASEVDPANLMLHERIREVEGLRTAGRPTIPVELGREKLTNPFLRADDPDLAAAFGMTGAEPAAIFTALRQKRDRF